MILQTPCAYQGGKQRIAKAIVDVLLNERNTDDTIFYDLCCGSGSISIELVNRGVAPSHIVMLDKSPWGLFWKKIGDGSFNIDDFAKAVSSIPSDVSCIQEHIKSIAEHSPNVYDFLILQAASFGSKAVWIDNNKWKHAGFRSYWLPTATSNRRSPVNPMMPMPETLFNRVITLSKGMRGVVGLYDDISFIKIKPNSVVYIDPPYSGTTNYGYSFDVMSLVSQLGVKCYVSEGNRLSDVAYLISSGRSKGGISGDRETSNEEWLNVIK